MADTKNQIEQAFFQLLERRPFEDNSVIEICKFSSISRRTFYNIYEDKYDLLDSFLSSLVAKTKNQNNSPQSLVELAKIVSNNQKVFRNIIINNKDDLLYTKLRHRLISFLDYSDPVDFDLNKYKNKLNNNFYIGGTIEIIVTWLSDGCLISEDELINVIKENHVQTGNV